MDTNVLGKVKVEHGLVWGCACLGWHSTQTVVSGRRTSRCACFNSDDSLTGVHTEETAKSMPEYVHDQYVLQLSKAGAGGGGRSKHRRVREKRKSTLMCSTLAFSPVH